MAAVTYRANVWTTAAGNKTSGAFTPAVKDLLVVVAASSGLDGGTTAVTDSQSGTYTQVDSDRTGFSTTGVLTVWVRNALVTSAVSTTVTVSQAGSTGGGCHVYSVSGMSRVGSAAVRSSGGQSTGTAGTTPAPVLGSTPLSSNAVMAAVANGTNPAGLTPPASFTENASADTGYNNPATGLESCYRDSGQTSATITFGSTSASTFASAAIELDTSINISAGLGALSITGLVPTVLVTAPSITVTAGLGALSLTGFAPSTSVAVNIASGLGALSLAGLAPTIVTASSVSTGLGALTLDGLAPTVSTGASVATDFGVLAITGYSPTISSGAELARISWTQIEAPQSLELARVTWAQIEVPQSSEIARISWARIEVPEEVALAVSRQQPAGRPSKRRRKPILVNIDGQDFIVSSAYEANQLFTAARDAAEQAARAEVTSILEKRRSKSRKGALNVAPLRLKVPEIAVRPANDGRIDQEWLRTVGDMAQSLLDLYEQIARDYEIALHIELQMRHDEEDALIAIMPLLF